MDGDERKMYERSESSSRFSTWLTLKIYHPDDRTSIDATLAEFKKRASKINYTSYPIMVGGESYARQMKEGEAYMSPVPMEEIAIDYRSTSSSESCSDGELRPTHEITISGAARKMLASLTVRPDSTAVSYRVVAALGGYYPTPLKVSGRTADYISDCKPYWQDINETANPTGRDFPHVLSRWLPAKEVQTDEEGKVYGSVTRKLPLIPLAAFNAFLNNPQGSYTFNVPFSEIYKGTNGVDAERELDGTITLQFGPATEGPYLEFAGASDDAYHAWLPLAEKDPKAKPMEITARLMNNSDRKKGTISFRLRNVSQYRGVCTNYPIRDVVDEPDMYIPATAHNTQNFVIENDSTAHTKDSVTEATIEIASRDYAAHGWLFVTSNAVEISKNKYDGGAYISLPEDNDNNLIADAWEREMGLEVGKHKPTEDLDELPKDQKRNGDGYSLFEEYRGLMTIDNVAGKADKMKFEGAFTRMNPNHKDVALYDETGLWKKYYAEPNPAELTWHLIDKTQALFYPVLLNAAGEFVGEVPNDRCVNQNTPVPLRSATQKCVRMVYQSAQFPGDKSPMTAGETISDGPTSGLKNSAYFYAKPYDQLVGTIRGILDKTQNRRFNDQQKQQIADLQYETTVLHEVGHALGIPHHCNGIRLYVYVHTVDSERVRDSIRLTCGFEAPNSDEFRERHQALAQQGVQDCAMTYTFFRDEEFIVKQILKPQRRYCREGETYIDDLMQKRQSDNCFSKIDVSCE
jgi:hypothetical protein